MKREDSFLKEEIRSGYCVSEEMKKVWAVELDLMEKFLEVCKKNGLTCYAEAGTLLGAVRHKGFIPWDDDVDLVMFREDYDKMVKIADQEFEAPYFFQTVYSDKDYLRGHAQLRNSDTTAILQDELGKGYRFNQGIFIDIFILDGVTDKNFLFKMQKRKTRFLRKIIACIIPNPDNLEWRGKWIRRLASLLKLDKRKMCEKLDRCYRKQSAASCEDTALLSYMFKKEKNARNKHIYDKIIWLDFENLKIPAPARYDEILRIQYGDYMKPLRAGSNHGSVLFDAEKPYTAYLEHPSHKKKICFVNYDMTIFGGAQRVLTNLANAFCSRYEVHVISLTAENGTCGYELKKELAYKTILPGKARIRRTIMTGGKRLRKYLKENEIDTVFYLGVYAGFCGNMMVRRKGIRKYFCDHGALLSQWGDTAVRFMRKTAARLSDKTIVLTEQSKNAYIERFGRKPEEVMAIYNWIDDDVFQRSAPYDEKSRCIMTNGRLSKEKGFDLLAETAEKLWKLTKDWRWEIFGEGEMMPEIQRRITEAGLDHHVILKGATASMYDEYKGHALYVLTSYREGLPLTLLEAKANHIPAVSFDIVSGPGEILEDGKDGVLIPPYDTGRMAGEIAGLLENHEKRKKMSEETGWNLEWFSKEAIMKKWEELIES